VNDLRTIDVLVRDLERPLGERQDAVERRLTREHAELGVDEPPADEPHAPLTRGGIEADDRRSPSRLESREEVRQRHSRDLPAERQCRVGAADFAGMQSAFS
jgi:hypothetical protein